MAQIMAFESRRVIVIWTRSMYHLTWSPGVFVDLASQGL